MSLEGRLSDFTLEEILQLIALQQKTGVLAVDASLPMVLSFEAGILVGYRDRRRREGDEDVLREFLKRYGFFTSVNWEHVEFVERNCDLDLTEILVNEGLLTPEELEQAQLGAAQELVFKGMQLRDGRYRFLSGRDKLLGLKGRVRIKVEGLLMESARRLDELEGLEERFGRPHTKVRPTDAEVDVDSLPEHMQHLLALCGKEAAVRYLIDRGRMSEFETLQTLDSMREEGWLEVLAPPVAAKPEIQDARAAVRRPPPKSIALPLVWGAVLLLVGLALLVLDPLATWRSHPSPAHQRLEVLTTHRVQGRLHAALHLHARSHGAYPASLEELAAMGWWTRDGARALAGDWSYQRLDGGRAYRLRRRASSPVSTTTPSATPREDTAATNPADAPQD